MLRNRFFLELSFQTQPDWSCGVEFEFDPSKNCFRSQLSRDFRSVSFFPFFLFVSLSVFLPSFLPPPPPAPPLDRQKEKKKDCLSVTLSLFSTRTPPSLSLSLSLSPSKKKSVRCLVRHGICVIHRVVMRAGEQATSKYDLDVVCRHRVVEIGIRIYRPRME